MADAAVEIEAWKAFLKRLEREREELSAQLTPLEYDQMYFGSDGRQESVVTTTPDRLKHLKDQISRIDAILAKHQSREAFYA